MTSALIAAIALVALVAAVLAIAAHRLTSKLAALARRNVELECAAVDARTRAAAAERRADELAPAPPLRGRTVVVHTRDEQTIRGVLVAEHVDRWTLRDAVLVTSVGEQGVGGLQHIPVANLSWTQELEP